MKNQEPTKPTGNLEELFRHHLAEAAVPPRPHMWEQIDNSLLLAQNQAYRRRLQATRWVAAASLLLASLAGTGWWVQREGRLATIAVAPVARKNAGSLPKAAFDGTASLNQPNVMAANAASQAHSAGTASAPRMASTSPQLTIVEPLKRSSQHSTEFLARAGRPSRATESGFWAVSLPTSSSQGLTRSRLKRAAMMGQLGKGIVATKPTRSLHPGEVALRAVPAQSAVVMQQPDQTLSRSLATEAIKQEPVSAALPTNPTTATSMAQAALTTAASLPASVGSASPTLAAERELALALLNNGVVRLALKSTRPLPTALALLPAPYEPMATLARRWRLGVRYASGVFQPNINFSREGIGASYPYNPALGTSSPVLTEAAAAEYLAQQRLGQSQRLQLLASRRLNGRWGLTTGLELTQQESQSATSYIFTGEQVYDYGQPLQGGPRRLTASRYRAAGVPLELQYANPAKSGFSLYGRVGAVISALLSSRTDVEANPEATRTYNLFSASTPYRRLLGTVRGAVGVQFRPAGHDYTLSLGPVAESGLWSMNAHPSADFFGQSRPYTVGLEAGVEFGRGAKARKVQ